MSSCGPPRRCVIADNIAITAGSGTTVATDDVSAVHYQRVKLDVGGNGVSLPVKGETNGGLRVQTGRRDILADTPTALSSSYTSGDCLGGVFVWSSVAGAFGSGVITSILMTDTAHAIQDDTSLRLWLFNAAPSGGTVTDNSALALSDTDMNTRLIAVVPLCTATTDPAIEHGTASTVWYKGNLHIPYFTSASVTGVVEILATGASMGNFASASELELTLAFAVDGQDT